jgi:hypothetical protein
MMQFFINLYFQRSMRANAMKTKTSFLGILALLTLLTACNGDKLDYRNDFKGKFNFATTYSMDWQPGVNFLENNYGGEVKLGADGMLIINYEAEHTIQVKVTSDGILTHPAKTDDLFWGSYLGVDELEFHYLYPSGTGQVQLVCRGLRR